MKKRMFSLTLALSLLLALAAPVLAAEEPEPTPEPEYRLTKVVGQTEYTFTYSQGGYLPTEVLSYGATCATASYDEAGRVIAFQDSHSSRAYDYDEDGNCVRSESANDFGDGPYTYVAEYTYDEAGNRVRKETTDTESSGAVSTSVTEYAYDDAGDCAREEHTYTDSDGTESTKVTEYAYDEDGNCVREETTSTESDGSESTGVTEYTYDEDGQVLSEVITSNGEHSMMSYTCTYGEDGRSTKTYDNGKIDTTYETPLVEVIWSTGSTTYSDGSAITYNSCVLLFFDSMGDTLLITDCNCDGEPTLTYDDNGYLVKVDGGAGNTVELTYEPVT